MPLTQHHRAAFTTWYCILFYVLMMQKAWNGMFLFQLKPHIFNNRFDMVTWLLMKTGIHTWLVDNSTGWIIFDLAFYAMPLLFWIVFRKAPKAASILSFVMLIINFVYVECYTLYPVNSIESFTPWLLFPFLFMTQTLSGFYFVLNGLRYFLLYFFVSAAIWKIIQHGLFNPSEMSGILLYQHKEFLVSSPGSWYTSFIYWLVRYQAISYILYLSATIFEFSFVVGFFTKKYDHVLVAIFFLFIVMDILIMRISYWEISPFILTLIFAKKKGEI